VGRTIGQGAFAKVKFAVNTDTGAPIAMKVLDKASILNHRMLQQVASPPLSPRAAGIQVKFVLLPSPSNPRLSFDPINLLLVGSV
jgi:serine/threonine protein kinase